MGKVANRKRREFFDALKERDGMGKPEVVLPESQPVPPVEIKTQPIPAVQAKKCCIGKFGSKMPETFIACIDCPMEA